MVHLHVQKDPPFNECLYMGPKFNQRILDILLWFRVHQVTVIADVEKAFLMVSIAQQDHAFLHFHWVDDVLAEQPNIIELQFTLDVFGVFLSLFLLTVTIQHHLKQYCCTHPTLVKKLCESFYVDDLLERGMKTRHTKCSSSQIRCWRMEGSTSATSVQILYRCKQEQMETKATNQPHESAESEETYASWTLEPGQQMHSGEQKVLGVQWNTCVFVQISFWLASAKSLQPHRQLIPRSIISSA